MSEMLHIGIKFGQDTSLERNIQFILEYLIENASPLPFSTTPIPKSLYHISHNYQPPDADFEAIFLEQAQLKGVGGEK